MKESAVALGKVRGYCYLIFLFDILLLFHNEIAVFFGAADRKILYGFVAIILFQTVLSILYVVKYVTTVNKDKKRKEIVMYAARLRYCFMFMLVLLGAIVLNFSMLSNMMVEKALIMVLVLMLLISLKNLTILERRRF